MRTALTGQPQETFVRPAGLAQVEVCALSGLLPTENCPYRRLEWFIEGTQPARADMFYREVIVDTATGLLATEATAPERREQRVVLDLPLQAQAWARAENGLVVVCGSLFLAGEVLEMEGVDVGTQG
jgi:hypothetical protein